MYIFIDGLNSKINSEQDQLLYEEMLERMGFGLTSLWTTETVLNPANSFY